MTRLKPITWKEGRYGFHHGEINGINVAMVGYDSSGANREHPYTVEFMIFDRVMKKLRVDSIDEGKAKAHAVLERLITGLLV